MFRCFRVLGQGPDKVQASISLTTITLLAARAVNVLKDRGRLASRGAAQTLNVYMTPRAITTISGSSDRAGSEPDEKRLAVWTYADFEGTIPKGQYAGGTVML
jgi:hypothetical protein